MNTVRQMMHDIAETHPGVTWQGYVGGYGFDMGIGIEVRMADGTIWRNSRTWYSKRAIKSLSPLKLAQNLFRMIRSLCVAFLKSAQTYLGRTVK